MVGVMILLAINLLVADAIVIRTYQRWTDSGVTKIVPDPSCTPEGVLTCDGG